VQISKGEGPRRKKNRERGYLIRRKFLVVSGKGLTRLKKKRKESRMRHRGRKRIKLQGHYIMAKKLNCTSGIFIIVGT